MSNILLGVGSNSLQGETSDEKDSLSLSLYVLSTTEGRRGEEKKEREREFTVFSVPSR